VTMIAIEGNIDDNDGQTHCRDFSRSEK